MSAVLGCVATWADLSVRAHSIWLRRNSACQVQDWLDAEAEINELEQLGSIQRRLLEVESQLANIVEEQQQDEQRSLAYCKLVQVLAKSPSFSDAAAGILQALCESVQWDYAALWMLDQKSELLHCFALWHKPSLELHGFSDATRMDTFSCGEELPGKVWERDLSVWIDDLTLDGDSARALIAAQGNVRSGMAFPIRGGNQFLGVLELLNQEVKLPRDSVLALMSNICSNLGECVLRHRLTELMNQNQEERRSARKIQQHLLPSAGSNPTDLDVSGRSDPSGSVGGDFFDYFLMHDGAAAFAVGDASGHGIGAAMVISETRAYLRALALTLNNPSKILTLINQRLAQDLSGEHFVTLLLVRIDPVSHILQCAGAGHHPGYVLSPSGKTKAMLISEGFPLGIDAAHDIPFGEDVRLDAGDLVFLYTDGVVESAAGETDELFGIDRALNSIRSNQQGSLDGMIDELYNAVGSFSAGSEQLDDITALLIRS